MAAIGGLLQRSVALNFQVAGVAADVGDRLSHRRHGLAEVGDISSPRDPPRAKLLNRRATRLFTVPLIQSGMPPGCNGFGIWWMPSKISSGDVWDARRCVHNPALLAAVRSGDP